MAIFGRGSKPAAAEQPLQAPDDDLLLVAAEEAKVAAPPTAATTTAATDPYAAIDAQGPPPASRRERKSAAVLERDVSGRRASSVLGDEWRAKTDEALDSSPLQPHRRRLLLIACLCILGNEFCERLAYYSSATNMGLYLKKELGYPADKASQLLQAWKGTTYLTPLAGAYLADALLGRFWVILIFSAVYLVGLLGLTLVNWIPGIRPVNGAPPPGAATIPLFWAAMYLTAAGAGGIKPCVSSFGADQFDEHSARERAWRASFFNVFYFVINVGSLLATLLVVPIQETKGYALGFGIPTIAFGCAILLFLAGWPIYKIFPPGGSPFARLYRVLRGAWRNRKLPLPADASELYEEEDPASPLVVVPEAEADSGKLVAPSDEERAPTKTRGLFGKKKKKGPKQPPEPAEKMPHTEGMAFLDKAAIRGAHTHGRSGTPISVSVVEESKAFYRIMPIFALVIIYQMTYDPIFTLLPYPGDVMDRKLGSGGAVIPASSISFANTFGVLLTIPLYDLVLVPLFNRSNRPITVTQRIGAGFFIAILALVSAGVIESIRYRQAVPIRALYEADGGGPDTSSPDPLDAKYAQPMSIWVQIVPYYLLGASEAFTNVGVMELFYVGVSPSMRAIGTACYLLTVAIGTYLATALNLIIAAATNGNGDGGWVANNSLYGHYDWYFYLNAAILLAALIVYIPVSKRYVERPVADADGDPFDREGRAHAELANVSRVWPSVSRQSRVSELRLRSQASVAMARSRPGTVGAGRSAAEAVAAEQASVWER